MAERRHAEAVVFRRRNTFGRQEVYGRMGVFVGSSRSVVGHLQSATRGKRESIGG